MENERMFFFNCKVVTFFFSSKVGGSVGRLDRIPTAIETQQSIFSSWKQFVHLISLIEKSQWRMDNVNTIQINSFGIGLNKWSSKHMLSFLTIIGAEAQQWKIQCILRVMDRPDSKSCIRIMWERNVFRGNGKQSC